MATERSSAGDPRRTIALLWRDPAAVPRRGPRRGLDLDAVVAAAVALVDRDGLSALTMRRVAVDLGVSVMTIYTYVPGKAELLDLMLDAAYLRMPRTGSSGQPWRTRVRAVADDNRELLRSHAWITGVSTLRPPLGPGAIAKYDHELSALDGLGLSDVQLDDCLGYILGFVHTQARGAAEAVSAPADSGLTEQQWWAQARPALAGYLSAADYPLASRVGSAAGAQHGAAYDPDHAYQFGLQRVLDGLAAVIAANRPSS